MNTKPYDVIVIGAGMGGLTCASLLAKKGKKVLILEKERQAGGYVVSFRRKDFIFDATGAFVGGCQEGGEFYQILKEIGIHEEIEFVPIHDIQNLYPGFEVHMRQGGFEPYIETLLDLFPEEEGGLSAYFALLQQIGEEIRLYSEISWMKKLLFPFYFRNLVRFYKTTHQTVLDSLFKGGEVKMALHTLPATEPPSRLSFLFVAAVIQKALLEGVFYPKGGMGKISGTMVESFQKSGGEVRLQKEVVRMLVKNGKVKGVLTKDGEMFQAPVIVSNINPNLLVHQIPSNLQRPFLKRLKNYEYSLSCFILYLATDLDLKGMGLPYFTYLRFLSDLEEEDRLLHRGEVPNHPTMIVSIPTLLDPSLAPPGNHILKVLVYAPYPYQSEWGKEEDETYHSVKEEFSKKILQQLEAKLIPDLSKHLLFYEAATPVTLERYTGNEQGAMYGLASTPRLIANLRPPQRMPLPGLFQVGHYTRPSHGIVGTSLSGLFASRIILKQG